MHIGRAIYKILTDDQAVYQTVENRIAPNVMAQTTNFPFIVYDVSRDDPEGVKESTAPLDSYDIMVSCYAEDYKSASDLANYIRTALDRKSGNFYGVDIQSIDFDGYDDIFDDMSGADGIYRKALDFKVRVTNSLNNIYSTKFDGVDEFVSIPAITNNKTNGSVAFWLKVGNVSSGFTLWRTEVDANNLIQIFHNYSLNEIRVVYKGGGTAINAAITDSIRNDGNWHHIAATWSDSADQLKIYLDGALKATTTSVPTITGSFGSSAIGYNLTNNYFLGNIDEFALFNTTLTATQITDIYNDGFPTSLNGIDGLQGYYKMGDGSTYPTINDDSTNSNNGTLTNGIASDFSADVPEG